MDGNLPAGSSPGSSAVPVFDAARAEAEKRISSGSGWLFTIAGLSVVNSIIAAIGLDVRFFFGMGITLFIDYIAFAIREDYGGSAGTIVTLIALGINVLIAGIVALFGVFARRKMRWPFFVGIPLYTLDGLASLAYGDLLGAAFHAFALYSLVRAALAIGNLKKLDESSPDSGMWQP